MTDNKLNRIYLRRQAQRVESYKSLVTKPRFSWKKYTFSGNQNSYPQASRSESYESSKETENDLTSKHRCNNIQSPTISNPSSSDSSEDLQERKMDIDVSSVMTRSATRKFASVGSIHNRVNIDEELEVKKRWPSHISYPTPKPPDNMNQLRDVVTKSFNDVLMFCKTAVAESQFEPIEESISCQENIIDLSPYITQESVQENGSEDQIAFHLNEDYITQVNVIALDEDQEGTLVIHDDGDEEYETITLHSGGTYLIDNDNYLNTCGSDFGLVQTCSTNSFLNNAQKNVENDHTYAAKPSKTFVTSDVFESKSRMPSESNEGHELDLTKSLNDLLLNTAILKCLICNETPQEMICQLHEAQVN
ncbi:uncharacterized protein LOC128996950 isoform X2 [Macrosteles quadrilineatus]|uniref:uncharacterized protein LOC128996950 isoform X2 n=1 Tax=Macrosteles quadrilineatus TaxID=74068 RepID=UPI0023E2835F|nr:uncharacterized protein LOC128996950 isoform X2 [Macrosteles quadrilineatus]